MPGDRVVSCACVTFVFVPGHFYIVGTFSSLADFGFFESWSGGVGPEM